MEIKVMNWQGDDTNTEEFKAEDQRFVFSAQDKKSSINHSELSKWDGPTRFRTNSSVTTVALPRTGRWKKRREIDLQTLISRHYYWILNESNVRSLIPYKYRILSSMKIKLAFLRSLFETHSKKRWKTIISQHRRIKHSLWNTHFILKF